MSRGQTLGHARSCRSAAGASIPPMAEQDFMPLDGWDHVELWVGNAKQAAYYYEHAFGFTPHGLRGARDRRPRPRQLRARAGRHPARASRARCARDSEIGDFVARARRRRARTSRCACPTRREAYRQAVQRGARGDREPHWVEDEFGRVELATIAHLRRRRPHVRRTAPSTRAPYLPGYVAPSSRRTARAAGVGLLADRPRRRQRRARPHGPLGRRSTSACSA